MKQFKCLYKDIPADEAEIKVLYKETIEYMEEDIDGEYLVKIIHAIVLITFDEESTIVNYVNCGGDPFIKQDGTTLDEAFDVELDFNYPISVAIGKKVAETEGIVFSEEKGYRMLDTFGLDDHDRDEDDEDDEDDDEDEDDEDEFVNAILEAFDAI